MLEADLSQGNKGLCQAVHGHGVHSPDSLQDLFPPQFLHHFQNIPFLDGGHPERDVIQGFRENASQAEHHTGPELGVSNQACNQFPRTLDHGLHQKIACCIFPLKSFKGLCQIRCIPQIHFNQSFFGLVGDLGRTDLEHHRISDLLGSFPGGVQVPYQGLLHSGNAVKGQNLFAVVFGKAILSLLARFVDDIPGILHSVLSPFIKNAGNDIPRCSTCQATEVPVFSRYQKQPKNRRR